MMNMTMVLKYGVEEMSLSQTNIQLEQINEIVPSGLFIVTHHLITYASGVTGLLCQTIPIMPIDWITIHKFMCFNSSPEGRSSAVDCFTLAATPFRRPEQLFSHTLWGAV